MAYTFPEAPVAPRTYELALVLSVEGKAGEEAVSRLEGVLSDAQGRVLGIHDWGTRRLAYSIRKAAEGQYLFYQLILPPKEAPALERSLAEDDDVLRFALFLNSDFVAPEDDPPPTPRTMEPPPPPAVPATSQEEGEAEAPEGEGDASDDEEEEPDPERSAEAKPGPDTEDVPESEAGEAGTQAKDGEGDDPSEAGDAEEDPSTGHEEEKEG